MAANRVEHAKVISDELAEHILGVATQVEAEAPVAARSIVRVLADARADASDDELAGESAAVAQFLEYHPRATEPRPSGSAPGVAAPRSRDRCGRRGHVRRVRSCRRRGRLIARTVAAAGARQPRPPGDRRPEPPPRAVDDRPQPRQDGFLGCQGDRRHGHERGKGGMRHRRERPVPLGASQHEPEERPDHLIEVVAERRPGQRQPRDAGHPGHARRTRHSGNPTRRPGDSGHARRTRHSCNSRDPRDSGHAWWSRHSGDSGHAWWSRHSGDSGHAWWSRHSGDPGHPGKAVVGPGREHRRARVDTRPPVIRRHPG